MSVPTNGTPISGLAELTELQDSGDWVIIQNSNGTYKMQASVLCWPLVDLLCSGDIHTRNGIFRGKDLTNVYTVDELQAKVAAGDFSNLFIGDYIDVTITTDEYGSEDVRLRFAHFDYFLNCGANDDNAATTAHHIVMVPENAFGTMEQMNTTATTEGGYYNSNLHGQMASIYYSPLSIALGGHILSHQRNLTVAVNDSAASAAGCGWSGSATSVLWYPTKLCLMSEPMVFGGTMFSSSGRDVGDACSQLALFALAPDMRVANLGDSGTPTYWWLCAVASTTYFACVGSGGRANCSTASNKYGVRPYFLFG